MVKRADWVFSGKRVLRSAVRAVASFCSSVASGEEEDAMGREMERSFMIWSAVRRRSEERRGESALICEVLVVWSFMLLSCGEIVHLVSS